MKKIGISLLLLITVYGQAFPQDKIIVGIVPFKGASDDNTKSNSYYTQTKNTSTSENITAIQDAVTDAFLKAKRFSLVEREKMSQIKSEKELQKNEDFIDGQVIEQSKSIGAQYIVTGNVSKATSEEKTSNVGFVISVPVTTSTAEIAFSIRVIDVTTGEVIAANSFDKTAKSKNAFADALKEIKPEIEKFIRDNFKVSISVVSVEEKNKKGEAVQVLISGGSSTGLSVNNKLKVQETTELLVDGRKLERKKQIGVIVVTKVEDDNFSICKVEEGGADILKKIEDGQKIKCELINQ